MLTTIRSCLFTRNLQILQLSYSFARNTKQKQQSIATKFTDLKLDGEQKKQEIITNGRSWRTAELRLKSNEDLHKLWYVCVREKNLLLADQIIAKRMKNRDDLAPRLQKVKLTLRRILAVINERQNLRKKYWQKLEEDYIAKKKEQIEKEIEDKEQLPEITWEMLRSKYEDLRKGIDNVQYLERMWKKKQEREQRKKRMQERLQNNQIGEFKSFWEYEMKIGERPLQEEVLRTHITNWRSLNLKQRKIILGFLNAKRSKDAKASFLKELKILGQKIAHDQAQSRIQVS